MVQFEFYANWYSVLLTNWLIPIKVPDMVPITRQCDQVTGIFLLEQAQGISK